jgi:ABC-type metal ion transport system substrate-binding protein
MADETATGVSGCSTDSSVHLIKQLEKQYQVDLFNRYTMALIIKDNIQTIPLTQLNYAIENELITADTLYFNNTVLTKKEVEEKWIVPIKKSWLSSKLKSTI